MPYREKQTWLVVGMSEMVQRVTDATIVVSTGHHVVNHNGIILTVEKQGQGITEIDEQETH